MAATRELRHAVTRPDQAWSMDFVADQMADGSKFRMLIILDIYTREALAIEVGLALSGERVVAALNRLVAGRSAPTYLRIDNGSEFSGHLLDLSAYHKKTKIDFSRPGKPTDNSFNESFNGSPRDKCLIAHWFISLDGCQTGHRGLALAWTTMRVVLTRLSMA